MDFTPLNDFFSNIKDKLTNPFFGTLIIVWLTRNWELVYSVFNFDNNLKLKDKVVFIERYFAGKSFWLELCINAGLAILFMLIGYLLIVGTRTISIIVEHNIMPKITARFISKDVVLKTVFDEVKKERDEYFDSFEAERNRVRKFSADYEAQSNEFDTLKATYAQTNTDFIENSKKLRLEEEKCNILEDKTKDDKKVISILETELTNKTDDLDFYKKNTEFAIELFNEENKKLYDFILNSSIILDIIEKLIEGKDQQRFISAMEYFKKGGGISGETITKLSQHNLIINRGFSSEGPSIYAHIIYKHILNQRTLHSNDFIVKIEEMRKIQNKK